MAKELHYQGLSENLQFVKGSRVTTKGEQIRDEENY